MEPSNWIKYRPHLITLALSLSLLLLLYFLGEIILPFFLGLAFVYLLNPVVKRIQRLIPNRNLAVSVFLVSALLIGIGSVILFGNQIIKDFNRLNAAVVTYAQNNSENLDASTAKIKGYIEQLYSPEELQETLGLDTSLDSLDTEELMTKVDTDALKESLSNVAAFFSSDDPEEPKSEGMNWFVILFSTIAYFLYIIYTYGYFEAKFDKYFSGDRDSKISELFAEFKRTFLSYFMQRSKVVAIFILFFCFSFLLIGIPGAVLFGILAGILCYIAYLQYVMLIPLAIGCLVLAIERDQNFFILFAIVLAVFIVSSILEEMVLFPYIMKDVSSMNPAIMMVSLAVWTYLLGTLGLLIGLPLTSLGLIYLDRALLRRTEVGTE